MSILWTATYRYDYLNIQGSKFCSIFVPIWPAQCWRPDMWALASYNFFASCTKMALELFIRSQGPQIISRSLFMLSTHGNQPLPTNVWIIMNLNYFFQKLGTPAASFSLPSFCAGCLGLVPGAPSRSAHFQHPACSAAFYRRVSAVSWHMPDSKE